MYYRIAAAVLTAQFIAHDSDAVAAPRMGFVWTQNAIQASYAPSPEYAYNSTGGGILARRTGTGAYSVSFAGLGGHGHAGGHVQVTAYGPGNESCKVVSWSSGSDDLSVGVQCFDPSGRAADSRYSLMALYPEASLAYVWGNNPTSANYEPDSTYTHNPTGRGVRISRRTQGHYEVRFPGLAGKGQSGGNVQVTAYGRGSGSCNVASWVASGKDLSVSIHCIDAGGRPADSQYTLLLVNPDAMDPKFAYAWGNDPTSAAYVPNQQFTLSRAGKWAAVTRNGAGAYAVRFPNLRSQKGNGGNVQVTAYGVAGKTCKVKGWAYSADFTVNVQCYNAAGQAADSTFSMLAVVSAESRTPVPNPRCSLRADHGPCKAIFEHFYFDGKHCQSFTYGGCEGTVPFETLNECRAACER